MTEIERPWLLGQRRLCVVRAQGFVENAHFGSLRKDDRPIVLGIGGT